MAAGVDSSTNMPAPLFEQQYDRLSRSNWPHRGMIPKELRGLKGVGSFAEKNFSVSAEHMSVRT